MSYKGRRTKFKYIHSSYLFFPNIGKNNFIIELTIIFAMINLTYIITHNRKLVYASKQILLIKKCYKR